MRRGTLLRNYAHVFAVMMRLRQLCCHRELLPVQWNNVNMDQLLEMAHEEQERLLQMQEQNGDTEAEQKLAEQLRDMIKEGFSDECSICLSEFNHPVITKCAHVYCKPCISRYVEEAR